MQPTEILMQEHRVIEQVLSCLEIMARECRQGEPLDVAAARQAIDFFRNFADRCHHGKEEDCLFPMLENKGFSREQGPTGVMLHEHESGRYHVRSMTAAIDAVDSGDSVQASTFASHAQDFVHLLREHIQKEDHCLFQMADKALGPQDQQQLLDSFAKVAHDDIGPGTHEKYVSIANDLADRFGVAQAHFEHSTGNACSGH